MADLTPVAESGVTDAFCYRDRRWRTDAPCGKGEARRNRRHGVIKGITRLLCQHRRYRLCCAHQYIAIKVQHHTLSNNEAKTNK